MARRSYFIILKATLARRDVRGIAMVTVVLPRHFYELPREFLLSSAEMG